jgi:hypothetical protein
MRKIFIGLILLFYTILPNLVAAEEKERGGGDTVEQYFIKNYLDGQERLNRIVDIRFKEFHYREFRYDVFWTLGNMMRSELFARLTILKNIKVLFTDEILVLDGTKKMAINYPSAFLIVVNRSEWMSLSKKEKEALAVHEVFGIYNGSKEFYGDFDDSSYMLSSWLLN